MKRTLQNEREEWKRRMVNQRQELEKLRKELARTRVGAAQLQTAVDGLLTAVTLEFGKETGEGEKELELPGFSASELKRTYLLRARRGAEGKGYVLKALLKAEQEEELEREREREAER